MSFILNIDVQKFRQEISCNLMSVLISQQTKQIQCCFILIAEFIHFKKYKMKKLGVFLTALLLSTVFFVAFTFVKLGGITGRVIPNDSVAGVSLVAGRDTVKVQITDGAFTFINLKEGVYTVWVKANAPYKDAMIENVAVKDSATTDLGEIKLQQ